MRLIEIVVQGVPGVQGALKYPLQPGLNGWKQKGALPIQALIDVIASLLYPSFGQSAPLGPGRSQKAGMTFEARGTTYRIVRDYVGKTLQLGQLEAGSQTQFRELSRDSRFITAAMTRSAHIPTQRVYRDLLVAELCPASSRAGESASQPKTDLESPQARLEELKKEEASMKLIRDLEFELDELQSRSFAIDEQVRRLEEPSRKLEQLNHDLDAFKTLDTPGLITPQIVDKIRAFPKVQEKLQDDLAAFDEKARTWAEELSLISQNPPWKDPFVLMGGGIALASFLGAGMFRPWLFFFLGLFVFSLALMVWGLWQGHSRSEKSGELQKSIRGLEGEKAGIQKRFDIETLLVRRVFTTVNVKDSEEALEMLDRKNQLRNETQEAQATLKQLTAEIPERQLKDEKERVLHRITQVESGLREISPVSVDPNMLMNEIRELESALATGGTSAAMEAPGLPADDIERILALASEALERPVSDILPRIQEALQINLPMLTQDVFRSAEVQNGRFIGFRKADGTLVQWALSESFKSALHLALQFALWQILAVEKPFPLILSLLGGSSVEDLRKATLRAAQTLSSQAQMIVLSE